MEQPVNDETILPEKVDDAAVVEEVEEVETEAVDTAPEETEETDNGEVEAKSEEADEPTDSSSEKKDGTQKRFDELTKLRRDAERDRDYWQNLAQSKQVAPEPVEPGKTLADFEYDEGKFAEYLGNQAKAEAHAESQRVINQEKGARLQADFSGREADFAKDVDDYHAVTSSPTLQFSQEMANATLTTEQGPALRYYLAKNPEISARLANMAPYDMAIELGRIGATKLGQKKPPSVTTAPKPVPKIAGANSKTTVRIDDPKISDAQFRKLREKQIANR